jgi:putative aldouronate transport system permease protein
VAEKASMETLNNSGLSPQLKKPIKKKGNNSRNQTGILHLMMLPAVILLLVYSYGPMFGILMAFQKFDMSKGFLGFFTSRWIGLANFRRIFSMPDFRTAFFNTVNIAWWKMVAMFFVPLLAALLLNEIKKEWYKRSIQTIIYLPHFLSWVILAGILKDVLGMNGMVNMFLESLGFDKIFFLGEKTIFPWMLVWTNVWKEFGFSSIIFLAAITGIDPTLYEAAIVDGAGRLKQTWHVTLPGMRSVIVLCAVLSLGGILNAGFDQVFQLYSVPVYETGDIIDTLVFRIGLGSGKYELSTALGLFKSVVSLALVSTSYWLAYKFADYQIF